MSKETPKPAFDPYAYNLFYGYPLPEGVHPEHPNWHVRQTQHGPMLMRADGYTIMLRPSKVNRSIHIVVAMRTQPDGTAKEIEHLPVASGHKGATEAAVSEAYGTVIARIDRKFPMPRPPFLEGQVWVWAHGGAVAFPQGYADGAPGEPIHLVWGPWAPWQDTRESADNEPRQVPLPLIEILTNEE